MNAEELKEILDREGVQKGEALCYLIKDPQVLVDVVKELGFKNIRSTSITYNYVEGQDTKAMYFLIIPLKDNNTIDGLFMEELYDKINKEVEEYAKRQKEEN